MTEDQLLTTRKTNVCSGVNLGAIKQFHSQMVLFSFIVSFVFVFVMLCKMRYVTGISLYNRLHNQLYHPEQPRQPQ